MSNGTFVPIEEKEFTPKVPALILELCDATPEGRIRRHLLEQLNVQEQQTAWLIQNALIENRELREVESRVNLVEAETRDVRDWKNTLTGKWGVLGAALIILFTAVVGAVCKTVADKLVGR